MDDNKEVNSDEEMGLHTGMGDTRRTKNSSMQGEDRVKLHSTTRNTQTDVGKEGKKARHTGNREWRGE